ncbi:MAG: hypothetical protein P8J27_10760, partial [Mariniblastus sp.]|nr:hypothetical protein [Mariniblastus sp.]
RVSGVRIPPPLLQNSLDDGAYHIKVFLCASIKQWGGIHSADLFCFFLLFRPLLRVPNDVTLGMGLK